MSDFLDAPAKPRTGEELDLAALDQFLCTAMPGLAGDLELLQFPSGHSNLTYLLRAGSRDLVLRRPPFGSKVKSAHDMGREYTVLNHLHPVFAPAPRPLLYCNDERVLGAPFYLMERVQGVIFRAAPPTGLSLSDDEARRCCESFVDNLAALHAVDYETAGLSGLRREGSYVERQVHGWARRYAGSQTDPIPRIDETALWLEREMPADTGAVLIHNDYKFDNIVLDPADVTRVIGVLDWEMATIGDPLMDLSATLGYWIEKDDAPAFQIVRSFITGSPGSLSRNQVAERYLRQSGRTVDSLLFYYIFALFKLAVICQQIYYRYAKGLTQDERFAGMIDLVRLLGDRSAEAIGKNDIEP